MQPFLFVCLAGALMLPPSQSGQGWQPPQQSSAPSAVAERSTAAPVSHYLRIPIAAWTASVAADQATTYVFSSRYPNVLHERNFLVRGLDGHPTLLVAAGAAIDAGTGWAAYRLFRGHPRVAKALFYGAAAYRTYLAIYNIRMMRRAEAMGSATRGSASR